ncbi:outer membrane protein transport protein [Cellulophaga sp. F20128]|uniref:OmpP1/FadL family transporter n=1 Tax=Cellulophaga sp. F20128 TaxID=2926413 RepID=UPI001FF4DCE7|nr:outer membrane protein transport protein [Cellulophaga sp. F20128]MCK0156408.1 outer membrane protein transport protein [Cellulophaga sp. F20128]
MKKQITFFLGLVCTLASAQNMNDVLQYSQENVIGTARYQGMSGAFGALGGDMSAIAVNPAGAAVFNHHQFTATLSLYYKKNNATYFNRNSELDENYLEINQIGGVMVFKSNNSNWRKLAIAANYGIVQNFDNNISISGISNQGIDQYFLAYAQGTPFGPLLIQDGEYIEEAYLDIGEKLGFADQQAFLGYYGGLIDPVDESNDNNIDYVSTADYSTVTQNFLQNTTGYNNKFTLNLASQYQENLYVGAAINIHSILYDKYTEFTEIGYDTSSQIQRTTFDNFLHTEGSAFSFTLGAIAKLNDNIRIGGSYQSPTWYQLTDDTSQRISSDIAADDINFINFKVVNLFEKYTIKTPSKVTGSLAVVFGKDGLLSFDYGFQDMRDAELRPTNDASFSMSNTAIANQLGTVTTYRLGGEYRIDEVSLRGGYRYEQSPYANGNIIGDLNGYSLGIGYNFGPSRLDLAFNTTEQDADKQLFDAGLTTPARINHKQTNVTLGYTVNF